MLEVRNASVSYGRKRVVEDVSLTVDDGTIVACVGHNGAGKTTLLRATMGAVRLEAGAVVVDGQAYRGGGPAEMIRSGVSLCTQGGEVFRSLTVDENLALAAYCARQREEEQRNREAAFQLFPVLADRRGAQAGLLSGGERQQLAIAMALMTSPRVLLLDEPSGGLAPLMVQRVFEAIVRINQEHGTAILVVEQNLRQVLGIARKVYVLRSGRLAYEGTPQSLEHDDAARGAILGF